MKRIQDAFFKDVGLKLDFPKYGYGNLNDGNTSRKFFGNHEAVTRMKGISKEIIKRLDIILNATLMPCVN